MSAAAQAALYVLRATKARTVSFRWVRLCTRLSFAELETALAELERAGIVARTGRRWRLTPPEPTATNAAPETREAAQRELFL